MGVFLLGFHIIFNLTKGVAPLERISSGGNTEGT